ncbi:MAG: hypothetical protein JWL58_7278 [Streptosporangiaceae bacterium]|jgi:hypothetical protein|nr:hypothetical protein [Streptosporangiaceae bacterium]
MPRLAKIRAGEGGCARCGDMASAEKRRLPDDNAAKIMIEAGLIPLAPYPGNHHPWRCRCTECGTVVTPRRANVAQGQGGCDMCGRGRSIAARRGDAERAAAEMVAAGLMPRGPYRGVDHPWPSRCLRCRGDAAPRLSNVRTSGRGCIKCGRTDQITAQRLDVGEAIGDMRAAGLEPLDDYPGTNYKWRSRCMRCGCEVYPRLQKIRAGEGGCSTCAEWGFKAGAPGWLYVLRHTRLQAVKVGISGDAARIPRFQSHGWKLIGKLDFASGAEAMMLEHAVLDRIEIGLELAPFLSHRQMRGLGGWTETFSARQLSARRLVALITEEQERLKLQVQVRPPGVR